MVERSMFGLGGSGNTRGGLDRYLGPDVTDSTGMPPSIEDPVHPVEPERPVDCDGVDKNSAVCQIAKAEAERGNGPEAPG